MTIFAGCALFNKGDKPKFDQNQKLVMVEGMKIER
jgi:hypothetical protein